MKVEAPELKRCCFCIPLRYGLIAWGYFKLALTLLLVIALITRLLTRSFGHMGPEDVGIFACFIIVLLMDASFTVVFLVGGHRKTAKLLHVYYIYSIVTLCIYGVLYALSTVSELHMWAKYYTHVGPEGHFILAFIIQSRIFIGFFTFGVQMYIILLIRSEVNKLRNSSSYRFSNLTAEGVNGLEHGTSDQRTEDKNGTEHQIQTDNQFVGIINQCKNNLIINTEPSGYKKF